MSDTTARRAAGSFAAGDVVAFRAGDAVAVRGYSGGGYSYIGPSLHDPVRSIIETANGDVTHVLTSALTPSPPAPTAIEVFEELLDRRIGESEVAGAVDSFREFCRVASEAGVNIAADEPLVTGGAL